MYLFNIYVFIFIDTGPTLLAVFTTVINQLPMVQYFNNQFLFIYNFITKNWPTIQEICDDYASQYDDMRLFHPHGP